MKGNFQVISARGNPKRNGTDKSVGLSIKLKGVIDEKLATRFAFGNQNGVAPDEFKGVLTKAFWTGDVPNFNGIKKVQTDNKITADVTVGAVTLNHASLNKMNFYPSDKPGYFNAEFQVYKSEYKDDDLAESTHYMADDSVECSIYVVQTDIDEPE